MTKLIQNEALYEDINQIIIDVRSPGEYQENHIVGSINIPLFSDDERAAIGTAYKQESTLKAKKMGMTYISNKIEKIGHQIMELSEKHDRIIIYCQRGGMRSGSICDLMNALDIEVYKLDGGMKRHRQFVMEYPEVILKQKTFVTLHGHTGVGKTKILDKIELLDLDVLNYEALAQHAGSVFGKILFKGNAPSQKFFEEQIFDVVMRSKSEFIFIESESKRVGMVGIPDIYMDMLTNGKHILVETSLENRVFNLIEDYGNKQDEEELIRSMGFLKRKLSKSKVEELIDYVKNDTLEPLVEFLLSDYYDPLYQFSIDKYEYDHKIDYKTIDDAVNSIIAIYQKGI